MSGYLSIYIAYANRRKEGEPVHWMILYAPEGEEAICTWIHVCGGPREGYQLKVQAGKRLNSQGIASRHLIGRIKASDEKKLKDAAKGIPMQRCQRWTTAFVAKLEQKGFLPTGLAAQLEAQIEPAWHDEQGKVGERTSGGSSKAGSAGSKTGGGGSASSSGRSGMKSSSRFWRR